jgi:thioredoxin reductase
MQSWRESMPAGMHLKSDGFASDLFDSGGVYTLKRYCAERGIPYDDLRLPVAIETFVAYGLAFQSQLAPNVEPVDVTQIKRSGDAFELQLQTGETLRANRVVIASGIRYLGQVPETLAPLTPLLCTHSSEHHDLSKFKGQKVVVIGGGSSATDIAALLHATGALTTLVSRHPVTYSVGPGPGPTPLWQRIRRPHFGLGSSLRSTVYTLFPNLFHHLPRKLRLRIVRRHLGPFAAWFVRPLVEGLVAMHEGYSVEQAQPADGGVRLVCVNQQGQRMELQADHVIAATGYKPRVELLSYLSPGLAAQIETENQSPVLTRHFESVSVPGLYFTGLLAANSFGPLLRFALGARFCAGRLAAHLRRLVPSSAEVPTPLHAERRPG